MAYVTKKAKGICQLCKLPVNPKLNYPDPWSASLDHITPISKGGWHEKANCQLAHLECNVRKNGREGLSKSQLKEVRQKINDPNAK